MKKLTVILLLCTTSTTFSQKHDNKINFLEPSDSIIKTRKVSVIILHGIAFSSNVILLNKYYYNDNKKTKLHYKKDENLSGMIDKYTHSLFTYQFTRLSNESFIWSGTDYKTSLIYSNIFGLSMLTIKEILDGMSENSGWSWYDISANFIGAGLYTGQELLWNKQRIQPKISFKESKTDNYLSDKNYDIGERVLKNHEAHTYWLSFNINSFLKSEYFPNWLNFSLGYSANGFLKPRDPTITAEKYRSYYVSLDIDLTEIKTKSHVLKTIFSVVNTIKIPAPTLQFSTNHTSKFYLLYF